MVLVRVVEVDLLFCLHCKCRHAVVTEDVLFFHFLS